MNSPNDGTKTNNEPTFIPDNDNGNVCEGDIRESVGSGIPRYTSFKQADNQFRQYKIK